MRRNTFRVTRDRVADSISAIRSIGVNRVLVGIPAENTFRKYDPENLQEPTNAMLGYIHEYGSPANNIPARPFLIPGIAMAQEDIGTLLENSIRMTLNGRALDVDRALHRVGLLAQNAVRRRITEGPFIPLRPATLARRRARGREGTSPLIDTTQLRSSITYVVRGVGNANP